MELPISKIELLTGENYGIWQLKVGSILRSRKLFNYIIDGEEPINGDIGTPARKAYDKWEEKNDEAFSLIIITLSPLIAGLFINERKAKNVWKELQRLYFGNIEDMKIDKMLELKNLKKMVNENVDTYILRAKNIASKCASFGQVITGRELVYYVVRGLDEGFKDIAAILRPQRSATIEEIQQILREEENRLKMELNKNERQVKFQGESAYRSKDNSKDKRNVKKCYVCHKVGHIAKNCWHRKDISQQKGNIKHNDGKFNTQGTRNEHAKVAKDNEEVEHAFRIIESEVDDDNPSYNEWSIDSGCTSHMTPYFDKLVNLQNINSKVNLAEDGRAINAEGKGEIHACTVLREGITQKLYLKNVLFVPKLRTNLLSVKCLVNNGNQVIFNSDGVKIINSKSELIAEATEKDRMYVVNIFNADKQNKEESINIDQETDCLNVEIGDRGVNSVDKKLWHRRLGHINEDYLENMYKNNLVRGINLIKGKLGICDACVMGKMSQKPFKKMDFESSRYALELIHMDICGPMPVISLGGAKYMYVLMDDYSRRIFVYFCKSKNETFNVFVEFQRRYEKEIQQKIGTVRSDNGGEFINKQFEDYLKNEGIKHQRTVPYTPQSNGRAERANRTILDKTRAMLIDAGLPCKFWAEAAATAAYIQNRTPTKSKENKTPLELWDNRVPTVIHMKVFGCLSYYYVPNQLRSKLEPKAKKGIFMGYSRIRKAYRIYDVNDNLIHEVRTVKFNETKKGSILIGEEKRYNAGKIQLLNYEEMTTQNEKDELATNDRKVDETKEREKEPVKIAGTGSVGVRSSKRIKERNQSNIAMNNNEDIPRNYKETQESVYKEDWKIAMDKEIQSLLDHNVWKLVPRTKDMKVIKSKWVYATKSDVDGTIIKRKARLVARGYNLQEGVDYEDSYSPVLKLESLRALLAMAAHKNLKIYTYDVQSAYLNGDIKETVYMEQPTGYICNGDETKVCLLQKSLYGLPQSGKNWNEKINETLKGAGLKRLGSDPCIYMKNESGKIFIMGLYVDDQIVFGTDDDIIEKTMAYVKNEFILTENPNPTKFLGIEIVKNNVGIKLHQQSYIETVLKRFNLEDCKPNRTPGLTNQNLEDHEDSSPVDVTLYQEMMGSLMYISNGTRPDITYNVNLLSQFLKNPKQIHLVAVKRIYRYLKGTMDLKLEYNQEPGKLKASADASWCTTKDAKSFAGYTIKLNDSIISWKSKKQGLVALSTCEAELMAICEAVRELKWLENLFTEIGQSEYVSAPLLLF